MKAKKTKENPLTFFRKANEARQGVVKKSIKKAQDGIETNDDLINKAGSTGGYKKSITKYKPWESKVELEPSFMGAPASAQERLRSVQSSNMSKMYNDAIKNNYRTDKWQEKALNETYPNYQIDPSKQKKGGIIKSKKK